MFTLAAIHRRRARRSAFTLLELVVVIAILAVLAGILVAKFPTLLNRANNTAWLSNLVELDKAISAYHAANGGEYPDGWDSLMLDPNSGEQRYSAVGATAETGEDDVNYFVEQTQVRAITEVQLALLRNAGIHTVQRMRADPFTGGFGATYFAYGNGLYRNPATLQVGSNLVFLRQQNGTYLFRPQKIYLDDTRDYILLGVGQACTLMGAAGWSKDCPVLRHSDGCLDPANSYCRALAIFDVGETGSSGGSATGVRGAARFIGTVAVGTAGLKFSDEMLHIPKNLE